MDDRDKQNNRQPFELEETPHPQKGGANGRKPAPRMNKRISLLMLVVLFAIMALLVFSQLGSKKGQLEQKPKAFTQQPSQEPVTKGPLQQTQQGAEQDEQNEQGPVMQSKVQKPENLGDTEQQPSDGQTPAGGAQAGEQSLQSAQSGQQATAEAPVKVAEPQRQPGPQPAQKPTEKPAPVEKPAQAESPKPQQQATAQPPEKPAGPRNQLKNIKVKVEHTAVVMDIVAERPIEHYKFFSLENPQRMVVDLLGVFKPHAPTMQVPKNNYVSGLRIGDHDEKLRIVADIKAEDDLKMQVERINEKQVRLTITR